MHDGPNLHTIPLLLYVFNYRSSVVTLVVCSLNRVVLMLAFNVRSCCMIPRVRDCKE